ncbi:MAG: DUF6544 family protein [Thermoleophilia bacterium]
MAEPRIPAAARGDWARLTAMAGEGEVGRTRLGDLPEAARRWLDHAVPAGSPAARSVVLETRGEIRLGRWRPLRAWQVIAPGAGFVWAARVGRGPVVVSGFDRWIDGTGTMRWRLAGLVPVASDAGPDVDRSAAGRLAAESVLMPPSLLDPAVRWEEGDDPAEATAVIAAGGHEHRVTVEVAGDGRLRGVRLPRWGSPDGGPARESVFRVALDGEARHDGIVLPEGYRAGWDEDPGGDFIRCAILSATLR